MADYIARPFQFGLNGRVGTAADDSDKLVNSRLLALLTTRPGERPLAPGFGTVDPTYAGFDVAELRAAISQYGPYGIELQQADATYRDDTRQDVTIHWDRTDQDEGA